MIRSSGLSNGPPTKLLRTRAPTRVFASGVNARLSTRLYSEILTNDYVAHRGWPAVIDYIDHQSNVLEFLLASKVISPQQYDSDAEEAVLTFLQNHERINADQLLTPLRNWLVFETEVARMVSRPSVGTADSVSPFQLACKR